jgi:hypothetical protein
MEIDTMMEVIKISRGFGKIKGIKPWTKNFVF